MDQITPPVNLSEISALVRSNQTEVDNVDGGVESSRAPVTRAEENAVRQVPRQRQQFDVAGLKEQGMSHIAVGLAQTQPIHIPPEFEARGTALVNSVEALQAEGFRLLDMAEQAEAAGDWGVSAACKVEAGLVWSRATPLRNELDMMVQQYQQAARHNDIWAFQNTLISRHPWAANQAAFDKALAWASKEFSVSPQEILASHPQDILAGCQAYEEAMRKAGKPLTAEPALRQAQSASVKAKAARLKAKNGGRLSQEQQRQLVSAMLEGIIL